MESNASEIPASLREVVLELFKIGVIRLGSFKLRSGLLSPIYIDLRVIISYPNLLKSVSQMMWQTIQSQGGSQFELICGVPYTALPFATCMAVEHNIPLIIRRKEGPKQYGTKKQLEGDYSAGQNCLVVEDLITSGGSLLGVVNSLRQEGLIVKDVVVFLDREQGGRKSIENNNLRLHSILNISQLLQILVEEEIVDAVQLTVIKNFIERNQVDAEKKDESYTMSFTQRAEVAQCKLAENLFRLMDQKKTNLALAADVTTKSELLRLADSLGPEICILKTHVDIITDFDEDLVHQLVKLSLKHSFFIFEDRKFADIGNTVKMQYQKGLYRISDWAHIVTVHSLPGSGVIDALKSVETPKNRGILLLAQMSSKGALTDAQYCTETLKMAEDHKDFVVGFIAREKITDQPGFLHITPGVSLTEKADSLGQTYLSVEQAIRTGSDIIVVGRGITQEEQREEKAKQYRQAAWNAYLTRSGQAPIQGETAVV